MTTRRAVRALALVLPAALLLAPTAAQAEEVVTHDPAGDVSVVGFLAEEGAQLPPPPDPSPADIVRTVGDHGAKRLAVAVHFRDLASVREHTTRLLVRTPRGDLDLEVAKEEGRRARARLAGRGGDVDCPGLRLRFDVSEDVVAVSVPTACVGSPRWVRLGVTAFAPLPATDPAVLASTVDDGHRDGVRPLDPGTGPRIHRG